MNRPRNDGSAFLCLCLMLCSLVLVGTVEYREEIDRADFGRAVYFVNGEPEIGPNCNACHWQKGE